ncbi:unnamed protein product [Soboliphyme baturini]|uniref:Guanylate kinase-like domain-containing protein n=1 Tax=Soboliphyme baturini TaxID=241478 RepID=A0A183IV71_9BILA|nr:unnamed protein product [Soboliphyme baturini]
MGEFVRRKTKLGLKLLFTVACLRRDGECCCIVCILLHGTTRKPKPGEIDGVDYRFISKEEFTALERNGELLERGELEGNFYGTPKPPKFEENELDDGCLSSLATPDSSAPTYSRLEKSREMPAVYNNEPSAATAESQLTNGSSSFNSAAVPQVADELGYLPPNWEIGYTELGEKYFIE